MNATPQNSSEKAPVPPAVTRTPALPDVPPLAFVPPFLARPAEKRAPAVAPAEPAATAPAPPAAEAHVAVAAAQPSEPRIASRLEQQSEPQSAAAPRAVVTTTAPSPWWGSPAPEVAGAAPEAEPEIPVEDVEQPEAFDDVLAEADRDLESWRLLEEEGSAEPAYGDDAPLIDGGPAEFPLDAFIIPEHAKRLPTGYDEEYAEITERVAARLEDIARTIRSRGISSLGHTHDTDELSRIIAALVAGYVGHSH